MVSDFNDYFDCHIYLFLYNLLTVKGFLSLDFDFIEIFVFYFKKKTHISSTKLYGHCY